jgi:hypothetical protein
MGEVFRLKASVHCEDIGSVRDVESVHKTSDSDSSIFKSPTRTLTLHKSSICINDSKPTKMVNGITRHFITTM